MVFFTTRGLLTKPYNPVFADNEWAAIIEACHADAVPDEWVADGTCYKDMEIGGTPYRIDIIGKNHDDLSDGTGKAPLTFQLHDCYATTYLMNPANTNVGGWQSCQMRTQTIPALKALMPAEVQAGIRAVNKLTSAGGQSSSIVTTSDELFLPSEVEVFGSITNSYAGEGTQYDYYKLGNSALKSGGGGWWWNSSPFKTDNRYFCYSSISGSPSGSSANFAGGVPFCFCF